MSFRAGRSVQTALIEWSKVITPALDTSKLLAKMFIDLSETMSIILPCKTIKRKYYKIHCYVCPFLSLTGML